MGNNISQFILEPKNKLIISYEYYNLRKINKLLKKLKEVLKKNKGGVRWKRNIYLSLSAF